jgi:hypothetical protein
MFLGLRENMINEFLQNKFLFVWYLSVFGYVRLVSDIVSFIAFRIKVLLQLLVL